MSYYVKVKNADGNLKRIEVSRDVYRAYYTSRRKEKYFLNDLKQETFQETKDNAIFLPSKEDSFERLLENHKQFTDLTINIEADIIQKDIAHRLLLAIKSLGTDEQELIHSLFFLDKTEVETAQVIGIPRTTLRYRKIKILKKLKKLL